MGQRAGVGRVPPEESEPAQGARPRGLLVLLGTTTLTVLASLAMRVRCMTHAWGDAYEYASFCYSDLQALWHARNLHLGRIPYVEEFLEYPTLTGTHMWLAARFVDTDNGFIIVNALVFLPLALVVTWALYRATGSVARVLPWAAGTALILYAVYNWELLAVAPLAVGLLWWRQGRWAPAGIAFGLGAAAKLFPLAALPLGVAWLWQRGRRRDAAEFAAAFTAIVAAANMPYMIANLDGWLETWRFHQGRFPDFGTVWYWVWEAAGQPEWDGFRQVVDRVGLVTMAVAGIAVLVLQWRRRMPMEAGMGILVATFLIVTKVHSPQYALWILPFLVVVPGGVRLAVAYQAVDLLLFVSGFRWIATPNFPGGNAWRAAFVVAVVARALMLVRIAGHLARTAAAPAEVPAMTVAVE